VTRSGRHISPLRAVRRPAAAAALAGGILLAGAGVTGLAVASQTGRPAVPAGKPALVPVPIGRVAAAPQPTPQKVARPVSLTIPSIGVRTGLVHLGLTLSGALQVPSTTTVAGWYTGSARPGATGAAVIVGHIDSLTGPGVFFRLRLLHPGSRVYILVPEGPVPHGGGVRAGTRRRAAPDHLRRRVRLRDRPLPQQRDRVRDPGSVSARAEPAERETTGLRAGVAPGGEVR